MTRYVLSSLVVLLLVAAGSALLARALAADMALDDASTRAAAFAQGVVGPLLTSEARHGSADDMHAVDVLMTSRIKDGTILHAKLWDADGRIIWSDEQALIGRQFALEPDDSALLGSNGVSANLSDLTKSENAGERGDGPLVEVYAGARDADGQPFLYESYATTARMQADQSAILQRFALLGFGSLALLQLALIPLTVTLVKRVDRARTDRDRMLRHALAASDLERRRIAADLHDGIVQRLSALGYALPAVRAAIPPSASESLDVLNSVERELATDIRSLRQMMTDIYPADLSQGFLRPAVEELAERAREAGLTVDVSLDEQLARPSSEIAQIVYRIVREGLRNAVRHAQATQVVVSAHVAHDTVQVSVDDDGRGPHGLPGEGGHVGLRLLSDTIRDLGGRLSLDRSERGGARLWVVFPLMLVTDREGGQGFPEIRR